jgi:hypothetical protein
MNAATLPRLLLPSEVAALLGLTTRQIVRLARTGDLPHLVLPDDSIVIDAADLTRWLNSRRRPAPQPAGECGHERGDNVTQTD